MDKNHNRLPDESISREQTLLSRLADALGCSVEALVDGARQPADAADASELLTIWTELENDEDRRRVLEFARKLAAS